MEWHSALASYGTVATVYAASTGVWLDLTNVTCNMERGSGSIATWKNCVDQSNSLSGCQQCCPSMGEPGVSIADSFLCLVTCASKHQPLGAPPTLSVCCRPVNSESGRSQSSCSLLTHCEIKSSCDAFETACPVWWDRSPNRTSKDGLRCDQMTQTDFANCLNRYYPDTIKWNQQCAYGPGK